MHGKQHNSPVSTTCLSYCMIHRSYNTVFHSFSVKVLGDDTAEQTGNLGNRETFKDKEAAIQRKLNSCRTNVENKGCNEGRQ